ncbi:MAG: carbon-nitrogen hydrolase family protein [Gallionella sp.]|nr:carbon-nitrogen hydrolase family protein [Gallionella sp.]MDP1939181.1 carbon-nitrogen hydrolase family protein [Gallionella sp.]
MSDGNTMSAVSNAQASTFKVAAIQMASGPNVAGNLNEARRLIANAAGQGARLVVLPEFFAIMGMSERDKVVVREQPGSGPIQDFLSETARQFKVWLVGGSIPLAASTPDKVRNSCLVFDDQGVQVARYDKIHLFNLSLGNESYDEAQTIEAGNQVVVVDSPFGRIGLAVCYDLRFPELFRAMDNVDIIVLPAAFTETTGKMHWEILVRARAIENLAYVIASAQGGYHVNGRETHGNSMIIGPWGRILDRLPRGSGVVIAEINPSYQASLRTGLPALEHRKISC